jgi:hypothetical protein
MTPQEKRDYQREYLRRPDQAEKNRARALSYYYANHESVRERQNARPKGRPAPLKEAARIAARKLVKEPCESCGRQPAQAHHDDYSKPLEVRWLCSACHGVEHRRY